MQLYIISLSLKIQIIIFKIDSFIASISEVLYEKILTVLLMHLTVHNSHAKNPTCIKCLT